MKITLYSGLFVLAITILVYVFIPQDTIVAVKRKQVEFMGGDFTVTFANDSFNKVWKIKNGKVKSYPEKGYYVFWTENDKYVQVPMQYTIIEEN